MFDTILSLVSKFIPDKDAAQKAAVSLEQEMTKQMDLRSQVIKAEIDQGGITAKWRPYTMVAFVCMVVIHFVMYDIVPFLIITFDLNVYIPNDPGFTEGLLSLIKIGLMGYIGGRSAEKIATTIKGK